MVNFFYLDKDPKLCAQYYCDKHVNKILIEILQILSQIHHNFEKKIPPYKKSSLIGDTLAPYVWALSSINNYKYCLLLAEELLKEYKFRFEKDEHKCEKVILWFKNNFPKSIKKKNRTKIKFTNNVKVYGEYFDDITAFRYVYVDFKCKNDKWTKRGKPNWFDSLSKKSELEKNLWVCPTCKKNHRISPKQRFQILFGNNYEIIKSPVPKDDILGFHDTKPYKGRLKSARKKTGLDCSMVVATGSLETIRITAIASEFSFLGASIAKIGRAHV